MAARTTARRVIVSTLLAVLFGLLFASSAAAHAELTNITPASGAQLTRPPVEVRMTFTESVNLVAGGIRLIDDRGATVRTPNPTIAGHTSTCRCRWSYRMGPTSSPGGRVGRWASDQWTIVLVVGTAATASSTTPGTTARTEPTEPAAPWPVITIRLAGYVAFAVITGVAAFVLLCAPTSSKNSRLQFLVRAWLMGGAGATGTRPNRTRCSGSPPSRWFQCWHWSSPAL